MRLNRFVRVAVVLLTCLTMVAPTHCLAASPVVASRVASQARSAAPDTIDVKLTDQGSFEGQVRNREGQPIIEQEVQLLQNGNAIASTTTRFDGGFAFNGVRPGLYQVTAAGRMGSYRVWQAAVAPPAAKASVLFVSGEVLRGQRQYRQNGLYDGAIMHALSNPWLVTGLLAAGIAIPIAVANDDDSSGS